MGGPGDDVMFGTVGNDKLDGGSGRDVCLDGERRHRSCESHVDGPGLPGHGRSSLPRHPV
jgi:hypothetical protein